MSNITNCILTFSLLENRTAFQTYITNYFKTTDRPKERFVKFNRATLPAYTIECHIFIGAFNYLDEFDLAQALSLYKWENKASVQLFIKRQDDERFSEFNLWIQ